jgi:hypothetical protein
LIRGRSENVGVLIIHVAQLLDELAVEKKSVKRLNLDVLEDDAEEEVCYAITVSEALT